MLILNRKVGESIVIPELGIVVTVVKTKGNNVRLGVAAPHGVMILRNELWERRRRTEVASMAHDASQTESAPMA